jgi:hypothetical protein
LELGPTADDAAGLYTLSIALFLIRDNFGPQPTFACLFLMLLFPVGGLVIYTLFGGGEGIQAQGPVAHDDGRRRASDT